MPGKSVFWSMHFKELFQLVYAQYGEMHHLTETEIQILLFLRDDSVYNTARDICKMRGIAKSNVSNGIRMLERKGYVNIRIDEENRKIHRPDQLRQNSGRFMRTARREFWMALQKKK